MATADFSNIHTSRHCISPQYTRILRPSDEINFLFPTKFDDFGYVAIFRSIRGMPRQEMYKLSFLREHIDDLIDAREQTFISQEIFRCPKRSSDTLLALCTFFVDLDPDLAKKLYRKFSLEAIVYQIISFCVDNGYPIPHEINSSGRGLHLKWRHDPVPKSALPRWRYVEQEIIKSFKKFGADTRSSDSSRCLRAIGTKNPKSQTFVRNLYLLSDQPYSFEELCDRFMPLFRQNLTRRRWNRKRRKERKESGFKACEHQECPPFVQSKLETAREALRDYNRLRVSEVIRIAEARDGMPVGMRLEAVIIALCSLALAGDVAAKSVDAAFDDLVARIAPDLDSDVGEISTIKKRIHDALNGKRVNWQGHKVSPILTYRTDTIIRRLQITTSEMETLGLRALVTDEMRLKRRANAECARRRAAGARPIEEVRALRTATKNRAYLLRLSGYTIEEVAKELGISRSAAGRILRGTKRTKVKFPTSVASSRWRSHVTAGHRPATSPGCVFPSPTSGKAEGRAGRRPEGLACEPTSGGGPGGGAPMLNLFTTFSERIS